jgi:Phosphotransferase enzyme family
MEHARVHGFPVPEARALSDTDIVMRRLVGPTMLDALGHRPWLTLRYATMLASLHRQLHAIEAPEWLPAPVGAGSDLIHLDLHPDNVMLTERGPMVIDWPNVARGPGAGDVAYTWIIVATAGAPRDDLRTRLTTAIGRRGFLAAFLSRFDRRERREIRKWIPVGAAVRLEDRELPPRERDKVLRLTRTP